MTREECCNLFSKKKHFVRDLKLLRKVTQRQVESAQYLNIHLIAGEMYMCSTCRLELISKKRAEITRREVDDRAAREHSAQANLAAENQQQQIVRVANEGNQRIAHVRAEVRLSHQDNPIDINPSNDVVMENVDLFENDMQFEAVAVTKQSSASSGDFVDKEEFVRNFNALLPQIGVEEIDYRKIDRSQSYCRSTMDEISTNMSRKNFGLTPTTPRQSNSQNSDIGEMLLQLKAKFAQTTDREERWKILSILPASWSANRIHFEFNVTWRMANNVKRLVEEKGILCGPMKRIAPNVICSEIVNIVKDFYLSENISHVCPGKRDYVTVNDNNEKITLQRRLVLMNLDEAYATFKITHAGTKVGFSKFASLRPPQCILALETGGTHSVCVCVYHQNVKLIFDAMKTILRMESYRNLFDLLLCNDRSEICKLRECEHCPGVNALEIFIADILEQNALENVSFKQWVHQSGKNIFRKIEICINYIMYTFFMFLSLI